MSAYRPDNSLSQAGAQFGKAIAGIPAAWQAGERWDDERGHRSAEEQQKQQAYKAMTDFVSELGMSGAPPVPKPKRGQPFRDYMEQAIIPYSDIIGAAPGVASRATDFAERHNAAKGDLQGQGYVNAAERPDPMAGQMASAPQTPTQAMPMTEQQPKVDGATPLAVSPQAGGGVQGLLDGMGVGAGDGGVNMSAWQSSMGEAVADGARTQADIREHDNLSAGAAWDEQGNTPAWPGPGAAGQPIGDPYAPSMPLTSLPQPPQEAGVTARQGAAPLSVTPASATANGLRLAAPSTHTSEYEGYLWGSIEKSQSRADELKQKLDVRRRQGISGKYNDGIEKQIAEEERKINEAHKTLWQIGRQEHEAAEKEPSALEQEKVNTEKARQYSLYNNSKGGKTGGSGGDKNTIIKRYDAADKEHKRAVEAVAKAEQALSNFDVRVLNMSAPKPPSNSRNTRNAAAWDDYNKNKAEFDHKLSTLPTDQKTERAGHANALNEAKRNAVNASQTKSRVFEEARKYPSKNAELNNFVNVGQSEQNKRMRGKGYSSAVNEYKTYKKFSSEQQAEMANKLIERIARDNSIDLEDEESMEAISMGVISGLRKKGISIADSVKSLPAQPPPQGGAAQQVSSRFGF
jgi:hypothetical protein